MRVYIEETENLSGQFIANFEVDKEKHKLYYDLDWWENQQKGGLIGGNYIQIMIPELMQLEFNRIYEIDLENGRKIYKFLILNGWKESF